MDDVWLERIKRAITIMIVLVVVLVLAAAGTVYWAAKNPAPAFALVQKYFLPEDLTIKWEEMNFAAKRASWRHWEIDWSTKNLTVDKVSPALHLPLDTASMRFTIRVFQGGPWFHFAEVKAVSGESASFKSSPPTEQESEKQSPFEQLQDYLGYLRTSGEWLTVDTLDVQVPKFRLIPVDGKSESRLSVRIFKPAKEKESGGAGLELKFEDGVNVFSAEGWVDANRLDNPLAFLVLNAEGAGKDWKFKGKVTGFFQGGTARFDANSEGSYGDAPKLIKFSPKIQLLMTEAEAVLKAETPVEGLPGPLVRLDKVEAEIRQPFDKGFSWSERPATFKIWGPVDLFFIDKDMRPPLEKSCQCKIPEKLKVTYEGRAWFEPLLGSPKTNTTVLDSKLAVEGIDNKLLTVNLNAHLKINKHFDRWILDPRLDSALTVQSFQGVRKFLDARNVMIPAPLDVLDGKVFITARGAVDHTDKVIRTGVDIKFDLSSYTQKVLMDTSVRFDLARNFKSLDLFVQVLIKDVKLEMPPIDPVRGIPSLKTDSRLVFKAAQPSKNSDFKMRVFFDVKTASPGAVKLLSKLAVPYAPLTIDINNNNAGESAGSIRLEPFHLSYLRRKVNVERLQVTLSEDENGDFPIGGRLRLDQTAYKIYVDLAGTLDAPIVNLNSEPFLPRADIISVLLFDRPNDQLVSADADTAGSFEAALADRAIGLFGLYAFATTPIRSFSYNAVTRVYTATIQLADGLTAGVGTNWERAAHLEVRKRVSRRWVLTASWSPTEEREQVGKLVLQWEKRF